MFGPDLITIAVEANSATRLDIEKVAGMTGEYYLEKQLLLFRFKNSHELVRDLNYKLKEAGYKTRVSVAMG